MKNTIDILKKLKDSNMTHPLVCKEEKHNELFTIIDRDVKFTMVLRIGDGFQVVVDLFVERDGVTSTFNMNNPIEDEDLKFIDMCRTLEFKAKRNKRAMADNILSEWFDK